MVSTVIFVSWHSSVPRWFVRMVAGAWSDQPKGSVNVWKDTEERLAKWNLLSQTVSLYVFFLPVFLFFSWLPPWWGVKGADFSFSTRSLLNIFSHCSNALHDRLLRDLTIISQVSPLFSACWQCHSLLTYAVIFPSVSRIRLCEQILLAVYI